MLGKRAKVSGFRRKHAKSHGASKHAKFPRPASPYYPPMLIPLGRRALCQIPPTPSKCQSCAPLRALGQIVKSARAADVTSGPSVKSRAAHDPSLPSRYTAHDLLSCHSLMPLSLMPLSQKGTADAPARAHALACPSLMPFSHAPLSCPSLTHPSLMPFSLMPLSQKGTADALAAAPSWSQSTS